jgi:hypothetical protein
VKKVNAILELFNEIIRRGHDRDSEMEAWPVALSALGSSRERQ